MPRPVLPLAARLWSLIDDSDPAGCWPWQGHTRGSWGHGRIWSGGRSGSWSYAHRAVWEIRHGPIPPGLVVRHRCDNPACCNPDHLELGTPLENFLDQLARDRRRSSRRR